MLTEPKWPQKNRFKPSNMTGILVFGNFFGKLHFEPNALNLEDFYSWKEKKYWNQFQFSGWSSDIVLCKAQSISRILKIFKKISKHNVAFQKKYQNIMC